MVSVIVPVYRNTTLVEYCLTALLEHLPTGAEVIVVDDASGLDTAALLRKFGQVSVVEHQENKGNTVAYNTGAAAARGDVLAFVDSDVFVPDGALNEFESLIQRDSKLGAIGSILLYPHDYTIQHAGIAFDQWTVTHLYVGRRLDELELERTVERQAVTAAFFACRRDIFAQVGGFSETYRDGLEDVEFCLRCRELGLKNLLTTGIPAMHMESATRGPYKQIRRVYNYSVFFSRWAGRFQPDLGQYLRTSAKRALASWASCGNPTPVINFCPTPNWLELAEPLTESGIRLGTIHNLSGTLAETDTVDLFKTVPLAFQRLPSTIVFIVEHFSQLLQNRLWFAWRQRPDIVIDRHANVLTSERFGFSGGLPS